MKIAYIGLRGIPAQYSGVERAVEEIATRVAAQGHEVTVYCMANRYSEKMRSYKRIRLRYVPTVKTRNLEMIVYCFLASLSAAFRRFDVVHFHAIGPSTMALIPRLLGKRIVVTVHGLDWQRDRWAGFAKAYLKLGEWTSCHLSHQTIVVSQDLQQHYQQKHARRTCYLPNGIGHFAPAAAGEPAPVLPLEKRKYLLFVGRLAEEKNLDLLIKAFKRVPTDMKLVILGASGKDDRYERRLRALARDDPRVLLPGPMYGERLAKTVSDAFLFVLPSSIEGLSVALLEAVGQGVPALVSDIVPNVEVIRHGGVDRGFTVPANDLDALADTMRHLVSNPHLVEEKRGLDAKSLRREYEWDRIADETLRIYEAVSGRPPRALEPARGPGGHVHAGAELRPHRRDGQKRPEKKVFSDTANG